MKQQQELSRIERAAQKWFNEMSPEKQVTVFKAYFPKEKFQDNKIWQIEKIYLLKVWNYLSSHQRDALLPNPPEKEYKLIHKIRSICFKVKHELIGDYLIIK